MWSVDVFKYHDFNWIPSLLDIRTWNPEHIHIKENSNDEKLVSYLSYVNDERAHYNEFDKYLLTHLTSMNMADFLKSNKLFKINTDKFKSYVSSFLNDDTYYNLTDDYTRPRLKEAGYYSWFKVNSFFMKYRYVEYSSIDDTFELNEFNYLYESRLSEYYNKSDYWICPTLYDFVHTLIDKFEDYIYISKSPINSNCVIARFYNPFKKKYSFLRTNTHDVEFSTEEDFIYLIEHLFEMCKLYVSK